MSFNTGVTCTKKVLGQCAPNLEVVPGEQVQWEIVLENGTPDTVTRIIKDDLSWHPAIADTVVTAEYLGGATGSSPATFPLEDTVTMPPGGSVTYVITSEIEPDVSCSVTLTNCAQVADPATMCEVKDVIAPTVTVLVDGTDENLNFPAGTNGQRSVNQNEILYQLVGGNECSGQQLMDMLNLSVTPDLSWVILKVMELIASDAAADDALAALQAAVDALAAADTVTQDLIDGLQAAVDAAAADDAVDDATVAALQAQVDALEADDAVDDATVADLQTQVDAAAAAVAANDDDIAALQAAVTALQASVAAITPHPTTVSTFEVTDKLLAPPAAGIGEARSITDYNEDTGYIEVDGNIAGDADTGRRDISGSLQNGFTNQNANYPVEVRRSNDSVYVTGRLIAPGGQTAAVSLDPMFRPDKEVFGSGMVTNTHTPVRFLIQPGGNVLFAPALAAGTQVEFSKEYMTSAPWDAALQGTPISLPAAL